MFWVKDGKIVTLREVMQKRLGRKVTDHEALEQLRKEQFIKSFRAHAQKVKTA